MAGWVTLLVAVVSAVLASATTVSRACSEHKANTVVVGVKPSAPQPR